MIQPCNQSCVCAPHIPLPARLCVETHIKHCLLVWANREQSSFSRRLWGNWGQKMKQVRDNDDFDLNCMGGRCFTHRKNYQPLLQSTKWPHVSCPKWVLQMETWLLDQLCFPLLTFSTWDSQTLGHSHLCHMKRGGENLLLLAARKHWPTFVPGVSRGVTVQEDLLHPEKEVSQVPLSWARGVTGAAQCWGTGRVPALLQPSLGVGMCSLIIWRVFTLIKSILFLVWKKKKKKGGKGGDTSPNWCTFSHIGCGCAHVHTRMKSRAWSGAVCTLLPAAPSSSGLWHQSQNLTRHFSFIGALGCTSSGSTLGHWHYCLSLQPQTSSCDQYLQTQTKCGHQHVATQLLIRTLGEEQ